MPEFDSLLALEITALKEGTELLSLYRQVIDGGDPVQPAELRMAHHALQIIFESFHIRKLACVFIPFLKSSARWPAANPSDSFLLDQEELKLSYASISTLELRLAIDDYENDCRKTEALIWRLEDLVQQLSTRTKVDHHNLMHLARRTLSTKETQKLRNNVREFDEEAGLDLMIRARQMVAGLKLSRSPAKI